MTMFFSLCAAVCLAVFALGVVAGLLVVNLVLMLLSKSNSSDWRLCSPSLLFFLRIFPFLLGAFLVCAVTFPSFLLYEPRHTSERLELRLLIPALLAFICCLVGVLRCLGMLIATRRATRLWMRYAQKLDSSFPISVYRIKHPDPLVAVTGILRPRIFVSDRIADLFTQEELHAAVTHEMAHVRSADNLKQLVLRSTRLPKWLGEIASLDVLWPEAAELQADQMVLQAGVPAVQLASAILKVARLQKSNCTFPQLQACHLLPIATTSIVAMRVRRMQLALLHADNSPRAKSFAGSFLLGQMVLVGLVAVLPRVMSTAHVAIEWLVR